MKSKFGDDGSCTEIFQNGHQSIIPPVPKMFWLMVAGLEVALLWATHMALQQVPGQF